MWTDTEPVDFYKVDEMEERTERHQQILKEFIAEERKKKGIEDFGFGDEKAKPIGSDDRTTMQDSVDHMPIQKKKKWRLW